MTDIVTRMNEQKTNWESTVSTLNDPPRPNLIKINCIYHININEMLNASN